MSAPYFIELIGLHEDVKSRYRFEQLPIRIGRAYDNDLILDDAYVAEHHAEIIQNENGTLEIKDLGSQNQIVFEKKRLTKVAIEGHQLLGLGHSIIRVRDADFKVAKELQDKNVNQWEGLQPALTGIAMVIASTLFSTWLIDFEQSSTVIYLFALLTVLAIALVWSGLWAFANRVISGHTRFGRHLFIAASCMILMDVWEAISSASAYMFSLEFLTRYGSHITIAIAGSMIFLHLYTINQQHPKRLAKISAALAILASCVVLMVNYQRDGTFADQLYMSHLLPPAARVSANESTTAFLQEVSALKTGLDLERLKPAKAGSGAGFIN